MTTVVRSKVVDVPPDELWDRIGRFDDLRRWLPNIDGFEVREGGRTRVIAVGGLEIREHLVEQGPRSYTYTMDEGGPIPVRGYRSTLAVRDAGDGKSLVEWTGTFEPAEGTSEEMAQEIVGMVYDQGLAAL